MKIPNKYLAVSVLLALLVGAIFLTGKKPTTDNKNNSSTYNIAIFQIIRHPVLDTLPEGFKEVLDKKFPGKIQYQTFIPEGSPEKIEQMATQIATQDFDLAFVIGTNCAQSLVRKNNKIPVVLGAATDPVTAGFADSWENPGGNITGTSDMSPIATQLNYLFQLLPQAENIGFIYNPSENNSQIILDRFSMELKKLGKKIVTATITSQHEMKQTVVSMAGRVDALYAPTDATVQTAFDVLIKTANEISLPVFNCDKSTAEAGAVFSVGFNYRDLGVTSGKMAALILDGSHQPGDMPIRFAEQTTLFYNKTRLDALKMNIPEKWLTDGVEVSR